ncbi:MAG: UDP-N-acetylglucosamine 1-carboxyvinyltransferase [Clostridia bacterium]|nr:UDP-N-acetylglucosamine 1-carboxyvinyltransferase [Clostridia bacterium]
MSKLLIKGGRPLCGEVEIKAAKNAVLPILAATLLTEDRCEILNVPRITDVTNMMRIMRGLGSRVALEGEVLSVDNRDATGCSVPTDLAKELRSSFFLLGPMLAKTKRAAVAYPGGCDIGVRPIDIHLKGLCEMGVAIEESHGIIYCDGTRLHGADLVLDFPSVGATENLMMAAVLAKGKTRITGAAKEPEIVDLQDFLVSMGAKVAGAGGDRIEIEGVTKLHGSVYTPIPDRIVAGTLLIAAAACGGDVTVSRVCPDHLDALLFKLNKSSCVPRVNGDKITLKCDSRPRHFDRLETQPYPGFPTDLQSQMMVMMCVSEGTSMIVENIFETRYRIVRELTKMGARITVRDRTAVIRGVRSLEGASVVAGDLRGGAALVIAGLGAEGYTTVDDVCHIERGYDRIESTFALLGGEIERIG